MLDIIFFSHALIRMKERGIPKGLILDALQNPDKVDFSSVNSARILIKKLYFNKEFQKEHLLIIITEKEKNKVKVVTIIDTSKVSKYF